MSKSQRIRDIFTKNLLELRNPMITGRQPINRKYLMQGKKAVKAAIKSGEKTGDPFSKSQLADIAQQSTDRPEIAANKRGGGKTLPPDLGPSDRAKSTKKALLKQHSSTDHTRKGTKALFESLLNEILKNPRRPGDLSAKPKELTRTPIPYPELVRTSRQLRGDLKTAKEGGLRALAGLAGEKPDPEALAKEDAASVRSSVAQAHARLSGSHKLGQTDAATRRLLRLPPAKRPTTAQSRALVAQQDREDSSVNYYREGLKALFENNYLRLHPVGKPGDQAIHNALRAHFDSLDPKVGADLHNQLDRHIKMYHYVRETPGQAGAHAELRRFEHGHLMNMAKTGSQGVTPNDVRQHFHMFNNDDPSDRLAHTAIKDSFYRPKESNSHIRAGLRAMLEAVLDEARGLGSQASQERQGKLKKRFDALDKVARKQRGTTVSKGGVTYIGNRPVKTRGEKHVSKERARVALKLEPEVDNRDPNPDPA